MSKAVGFDVLKTNLFLSLQLSGKGRIIAGVNPSLASANDALVKNSFWIVLEQVRL